MARQEKTEKAGENVVDYRHKSVKRLNIPPAGLTARGEVVREKKVRYAYNPHLAPVLRMEGVDIYDPVTSSVRSTGADKVAAWFFDSDYDGRCFCVCQAFFPDKTAWDKLGRALGGTLDPDAFAMLSGTVSLPLTICRTRCPEASRKRRNRHHCGF
jgi:hypothetical protein